MPLNAVYQKTPAPKAYEKGFFDNELGNIQRAMQQTVTRTITKSTTGAPNDTTVLCDATSGAITYTLPAASSSLAFPITIKKIDSSTNAITIGATVDGTANPTLTTQYATITVISDGTSWYRLVTIPAATLPTVAANGTGSSAINSGVATTIVTVPNVAGAVYLVSGSMSAVATGNFCMCYVVVNTSGTPFVVFFAQTGANFSAITVDGSGNCQFQQNTGSNRIVTAAYIRLV